MSERPTLAEVARRHAGLVILPVVAITAVLLLVGAQREPTHTARTDLIIGKIDPRIGQVTEFVTNTIALGKGYTRTLESDGVVRAVSRRTGLTRDQVLARTSASVDEATPILHLKAQGRSSREAIELASVLGKAVVREIDRVNRPSPGEAASLREYRRVSEVYERLAARGRELQDQLNQQAVPSEALRLELARVRADAETTRLRAIGSKDAYEAAKEGVAHNLVRVLAPPRTTTTDRARVLEFLAYVGVVAGLAIGLTLARRRSNREPARFAGSPLTGAG